VDLEAAEAEAEALVEHLLVVLEDKVKHLVL
jgi:hypothetical protein